MTALPCGQHGGDLLRVVADGPNAAPDLADHARTCPHCSAELARLDRQWDRVRHTAARPQATPPGLADRMVDLLRELRAAQEVYHTVDDGVRVADHVVVVLARRIAADAVAGLAHVRGVRTANGTVHIGLAVRFGVPVDALAERLRTTVLTELTDRVGPVASAVDVRVVDVAPRPIG